MQFDLGAGYWLYTDHCGGFVTGIASVCEVHTATWLDDGDIRTIDAIDFLAVTESAPDPGVSNEPSPTAGSPGDALDLTNLTVGGHVQFRGNSIMRAAVIVPLQSRDDRAFDTGFSFQWDLYR
jgi:hypothetical protein